ncbi:cell division protein ZapE [Microbacterium sp. 179-B 1A2 NHS]|uniref:cell division protein ZapE n=1 Tax=Microbacterium sp. 179-B 1A2 NHS TaxID=3142383 RepID=UPI0039A219CF
MIPARDPLSVGAVHARFADAIAASGMDLDDAQRAAVEAILAADRVDLYLHGPVGRGKSLLAELYLAALDVEGATRLHLNELFRLLQAEIARDWKTPAVVLRRLLEGTGALLIDEFHVHDVADAVYLSALLQVATEDDIVLVTTSNYSPADLLPDPQHHHRFAPAIAQIQARATIVAVGEGPDHRAQGHETRRRFASGSWRAAPEALPVTGEVVGGDRSAPARLDASGIPLHARRVDGRRVVFTFAQLCESEVGVREYQWLADRFDALELHEVPDLGGVRTEPLMRLTTLVDVLYDRDVRLDVIAAGPFARLAEAARVPVDAARTLSRLGALRG